MQKIDEVFVVSTMDESFSPSNFPYSLPPEFGEVKAAQEEGPGVYYISALPPNNKSCVPTEYYVVTFDSEIISHAVTERGTKIEGTPTLYLFDLDFPDSGHLLVEYEIARYHALHSHHLSEGKSMIQASRYAMEYHPDYFGEIPVPTHTPWGQMTRYRTLLPGVFWIETENAKTCVSVFYPIWDGDLTDYAKGCAQFLGSPAPSDLVQKLPCAFYDAISCCLPIFELYKNSKVLEPYIDYPKLMNTVWKHYPDYAAMWNLREQLGLNDIPTLVLRELGINSCSAEHPTDTISITPDADENFFLFTFGKL